MSSTPAENWRLSAASTVVTWGTAAVANIGSMVAMSWLAAPSITESPIAVTAGGVRARRQGRGGGVVGCVVVVAWPATVVVDGVRARATTCVGDQPNPAGAAALPPLPSPTTMTTRPDDDARRAEREAGHQLALRLGRRRPVLRPPAFERAVADRLLDVLVRQRGRGTNVSASRSTSNGMPVSGTSECGRVTM